jgi:hypothetical protein
MRLRGIAVLAVLIAGCGGDNDSGGEGGAERPAAPETIAASEWSAKVEGMCEAVSDRGKREATAIVGKTRNQAKATARVLELTVEITEPYIEKMDDLPPPEGREQQATRFFGLMRRSMTLYGDIADGIEQNDPRYVKAMTSDLREVAGDARGLARDLEIDACIPSDPGGSS